jgi:hypothetical protein
MAFVDVWKAAVEGKVFKLIIEKDFRRPGFLNGKSNLYLIAPRKPCMVLADAMDDLIEVVLANGGQVFFVADGLLTDYKKIAAIHRYR